MERSTAREIAFILAFELSFTDMSTEELLDNRLTEEYFSGLRTESGIFASLPNKKQAEYIRRVVLGVAEHGAELDVDIAKYSARWKFERIPLVASAIMRVAMYEMLYMPDIPNGAAINEAVELAKKYEEPEVASFVNGILGAFERAECK